MGAEQSFVFGAAFDRNIGWLTEWEQQALRGKTVAVAGMGGVGGFHALTLARLGVGAFHIADLDRFEIANFNRQIGASMKTLGEPKVEVLADMLRAINPEARLAILPGGVKEENVEDFLQGVDLFIDGFDFFVLDIRRKVFARCAELGIPALTAAPVGMGVGFVAFTRDSMSFEDYFRFEGRPELQQYIHFLLGMAPRGIHRVYLVDPGRLDFGRRAAPSTVVGVQLAASVTASVAVKLLLNRGGVKPAPHHHHYDAYLGRVVDTTLRQGNDGPLQKMKARAAERFFRGLIAQGAKPEPAYPATTMEEIINVARWAPSGDNSQPWRFRIIGDDELAVSIRMSSSIYEYRDGEPTLISAGMLLANLGIAASAFGRSMEWRYLGRENGSHSIACFFRPSDSIKVDDLYSFIPLRSVDRRPYRTTRLTEAEKAALSAALGDDLELVWLEGEDQRFKMAQICAASTNIRLRIPETFEVHRRIIDWHRRQSPTGIPAGALGLDKTTLRIMRWAMASWERMNRLNRTAGTFGAALQMDYVPGYFSSAYFMVRPKSRAPDRVVELLKAGARLQRFWLLATKLGLAVQPTLAPLAFAHVGRMGAPFTADMRMRGAAARLASRLDDLIGASAENVIFAGRIGRSRPPGAVRSTRLPLSELIEKP